MISFFTPSFFEAISEAHTHWREHWEKFEPDATLSIPPERITDAWSELMLRLKDNYPFFHPSYAGQMLKPPHPAAVAAYVATMLINPNNHALDGGPATGQMEKEVVADIAAMFGYDSFLGHLTSSGTIANLEALWISREVHPAAAIAFSEQSHYTHNRMCKVLGVRTVEIPCDNKGKMDVDALRSLCRSENIGTVVVTLGTTGLGALDPLPALVELQNEFRFRIHCDAAYGGFFRLLAESPEFAIHGDIFQSMSSCDSIVVDPHKHGLQPYGCGCVLFRDPAIGIHYKHNSPYTYFTSDELHLGEISLECSRAGASAAALWFTLQCLPLRPDTGLGPVLMQCRKAALRWVEMIRSSQHLFVLLEPELDIVTFFPKDDTWSASEISQLSDRVFRLAMADELQPVYLSKLRVRTSLLRARYPNVLQDKEWTNVLRSALMKPEHFDFVPELHRRIEGFVGCALKAARTS